MLATARLAGQTTGAALMALLFHVVPENSTHTALLLAGALAFGALFGAVMYGAYDHIQGEPRLMVILGCQPRAHPPAPARRAEEN